jgi:hypothetical protein
MPAECMVPVVTSGVVVNAVVLEGVAEYPEQERGHRLTVHRILRRVRLQGHECSISKIESEIVQLGNSNSELTSPSFCCTCTNYKRINK